MLARFQHLGPLSQARVTGVSEAAASRGLKIGDLVVYETHRADGFVVDDQPYLSVDVQYVVGRLETP